MGQQVSQHKEKLTWAVVASCFCCKACWCALHSTGSQSGRADERAQYLASQKTAVLSIGQDALNTGGAHAIDRTVQHAPGGRCPSYHAGMPLISVTCHFHNAGDSPVCHFFQSPHGTSCCSNHRDQHMSNQADAGRAQIPAPSGTCRAACASTSSAARSTALPRPASVTDCCAAEHCSVRWRCC